MSINVKSTSIAVGDDSWLAGRHGTDDIRSITLDISAFTEGTHYPNGFLKSGLPLGEITASGKFGPYAASPNETQTLTIDATAGTYTLGFAGETTAAIAFDATAAQVEAALETLAAFDVGDVSVTGGPGDSGGTTPYTVTFTGQYAGVNVPLLVATDVNLTGGGDDAAVAQVTAGGGAVTDGRQVLAGFLFKAVPIPDPTDTTVDGPGALFTHGRVVAANLPVSVDDAGRADVAGRIQFT